MQAKPSLLDIIDIAPAFATLPSSELTMEVKQMVAFLLSQGEPMENVAKKLKLEIQQVRVFSESVKGTEMIVRFQSALYPDPAQRVKKLANLAIDVNAQIMLRGETKPELRAKVASDFMDRSMGKAIQVTENRNLNITVESLDAADKALKSQNERLAKLEAMQKKLIASRSKT